MIASLQHVVYGPVPSWRLGRSLGIDMVSRSEKTCSFDCTYCQLGGTRRHSAERREFVSIPQLTAELEQLPPIDVDHVTFSGTAEPTLAANLGEAIRLVRDRFSVPVAVLTNASLMSDSRVRRDLAQADEVIAKLDAPTQQLLEQINRPVREIALVDILAGLHSFRRDHRARLALQIMFCRANRRWASALAVLARAIEPDEVQINTPLRPCAVQPLSRDVLANITGLFSDLSVRSVYEAPRPAVQPLSMSETLARRVVL